MFYHIIHNIIKKNNGKRNDETILPIEGQQAGSSTSFIALINMGFVLG